MQETRVWSLIWEDPMPQSNWACVPQLFSLCSKAHALKQEKPLQWEAHALKLEESVCSNKDPAQPKIKINKIIIYIYKTTHLLFRALVGFDWIVDVLHGSLNKDNGVWSLCFRVHTFVGHNSCNVPKHLLQLCVPFFIWHLNLSFSQNLKRKPKTTKPTSLRKQCLCSTLFVN